MSQAPRERLRTLLSDTARAGVYRGDDEAAHEAFRVAASLHYVVQRIDLIHATDAASTQALLGRALQFPDWYGHNWDALADCLSDMSWNEADGYVLILTQLGPLRAQDREAYDTLVDVLRDASESWREASTPFWVLLPDGDELPALPLD
ncbi:barstar family protein [Uliginosibacterium sp. H1]|uniref:barstar family protein n=1 Tax=Uliginosibacterium sp. H1 TaxID=3114757 RepID=UPI002E16FF15|nr:barstar family protein [Uliginosibacterium sp. H1]